MIIKSTAKIADGLCGITPDKDILKFHQIQNVTPILEKAHLMRQFSDNGFTDDRNYRMVGTIPAIEFVNHPEWANDPNLIKKWLKSDEGAPYRTVRRGI